MNEARKPKISNLDIMINVGLIMFAGILPELLSSKSGVLQNHLLYFYMHRAEWVTFLKFLIGFLSFSF